MMDNILPGGSIQVAPSDLTVRLNELVQTVARCQELSRYDAAAGIASTELLGRDLQIIQALSRSSQPITFADIVRIVDAGVENVSRRSTMSQAVDKLATHQLLKKAYNEHGKDKRQPIVCLTPRGEQLACELNKSDRTVIEETIAAMDLNNCDADALRRLLTPFRERLGDPTRAHPARIYNYFLGGTYFLPIDRIAGKRTALKFKDESPGGDGLFYEKAVIAHRTFIERAATFVARDCKIAQFIDVGAGFPVVNNVHEIVSRFHTNSETIYVDKEAAIIDRWRIDKDLDQRHAIQADITQIDPLLNQLSDVIDFRKPVAVILGAILHFVGDDKLVAAIVRRFREQMTPGSCLIISHARRWTASPDDSDSEFSGSDAAERMYRGFTSVGAAFREEKEIMRWLDGTIPLKGGLNYISSWGRNITDPPLRPILNKDANSLTYGGVFQVAGAD